MIVLDAYALVAFLADEPARAEVAEILREPCVMSTVNFAESLDVLTRVHAIDPDELRGLVDPLRVDTLGVESPDPEDAWLVAALRSRHYDRTERDLSLGDCFLLASASRRGASIATADPAVAATARDESIGLVPLPDRVGNRPA